MHADTPANILLVDDHPENLLALSAILNREEYRIVTATSGEQALSRLLHDDFAVILLDVIMPGMTGLELATLIKHREKTRAIPIIFLTAVAKDIRDIYNGYSVGAVDYIQKPLDPEVVRAKVAVFVELYRGRERIRAQEELIRASERAQSLERERAARIRAEAAEHRYYDLINWVDHAVLWEYDALKRKFTFVSQRSQEILGYSPAQWVSDPAFLVERIAPEDRSQFEEMLENGVSQGIDGRCEVRFFRGDGETLWIHSGINPRKDVSGKVILLWGLTLDITDFKSAEANQRFLAEASAEIGSSLDYPATLRRVARLLVPTLADWCTVRVSSLGGTGEELVTAHRDPRKDGWLRNKMAKFLMRDGSAGPVAQVIRSGQPLLERRVTESFLIAAAQSPDQLRDLRELGMKSLMIVPLKSRENVLGTITLVSDRPYRHYSERDLKFAQELAWHLIVAIDNARLYGEAQKAIEMREEILGIVSHDLKGPLSAIGMNAQMILREGKRDPREHAERIARSVERMNGLISDLLDLAKLKAGKLKLDVRSQEAQSLLREIVEAASPMAARKPVTLRLDLPTEPLRFPGDHDRLYQVLSNLVGNAIKFTPPNGQVTIGVRPRAEEIEFCVSDSGPGIPSAELEHVFESYYQTPEGKRMKGGTGLGLYIAKTMVDAHHGRIWVNSQPGQGARFYFVIPLGASESLAS